jgi:hypothetical protein
MYTLLNSENIKFMAKLRGISKYFETAYVVAKSLIEEHRLRTSFEEILYMYCYISCLCLILECLVQTSQIQQ